MQRKDWNKIELVVSDFDGVMTDNRVLVSEDGAESAFVSRADGQGIDMLRDVGIVTIIISTEKNAIVEKRAIKLGVSCIYGATDKKKELQEYCSERGINLENVAYVGNDINDYEALMISGVKIVPADAYEEVKRIADYVTIANGGCGVIREIAGIINGVKHNG